MHHRAGVRYEKTGLVINDESKNEFGISFGVGLPLGNRISSANFGFEIGHHIVIYNPHFLYVIPFKYIGISRAGK